MDNNTFWILFWVVMLAGVNGLVLGLALIIAHSEIKTTSLFVEHGYEKVAKATDHILEWVKPRKDA